MIAALGIALFCGLTAFGVWKSEKKPQGQDPREKFPLVVKGKPINSPVTPEGEPKNTTGLVPANPDRVGIPDEGQPGGDATSPNGGPKEQHGVDASTLAKRDAASLAEYPDLGFEVLANYTYVPPPKQTGESAQPRKEQIPADILSLSGRKVAVTGYMLPTEMEEDRVTQFLLLRSPMQCCFGVAPQVNEWVVVNMTADSPPVEPEYKPVSALGVLEVGEEIKDGWVTSVYRMRAVKVEVR